MRKLFYITVAVCALSACSQEQRGAFDAQADKAKANVHAMGMMIEDAFTYSKPAPPQPGIPQTRYCYQAFYDIVCYDTPQEGNVGVMTGYQGPAPLDRQFNHAEVEPVMAAPTSEIEVTSIDDENAVADAPFEVRSSAAAPGATPSVTAETPAKVMTDVPPSGEPAALMPRM